MLADDSLRFTNLVEVISIRIIKVDHAANVKLIWLIPVEHLEYTPFGSAIILKGLMLIEMLVGDVGQHRDIQVDTVDAPLRQAVTGHLDHRISQAIVHHLRKQRLNLRRTRRSDMQSRIERLIAYIRADCADQPGASTTVLAQYTVEKRAGRRLAICACDAEYL